MASLTSLASELQLMILQHSLPYDFENLALTCKHLYDVSTPLLPRHNSLRRRYRRFRCGNPSSTLSTSGHQGLPPDFEAVRTVPALLLNIAADPVIAQYVVHVDLRDRERVDGNEQDEAQEGGVAELRELIRRSDHLAMVGADPDVWFRRIVADLDWTSDDIEEVDYPVAFLLSLLHNIESLALPTGWHPASIRFPNEERGDDARDETQRSVVALLRLLITRANDVAGVKGDQPLRKLRALHPTRAIDADEQYGVNLSTIAPFLALDSLREVHNESGVCDYLVVLDNEDDDTVRKVFDFQAQGLYPILGRNLETLILENTVMEAEASAVFFKDMHKLKVVEIDYSMKDEVGWNWEPEGVIRNLYNSAGKTLESLSLTANILGGEISPLFGEDSMLPDDGLGSFEVLKYLKLDTKLFIRNSNRPGVGEHTSASSLIDIAPPTLKTFVLHVPAAEQQCAIMKTLLCGLDERKGELPDLESVSVIMHRRGCWSELLDDWETYAGVAESFCKGLGIAFSVTGRLD